MSYKLLTCLLCILVLSPIRATISDIFFDTENLGPLVAGAERFATIGDIPDEIGNLIAQRILKDNPKINEAKIFTELNINKNFNTKYVSLVAWSPDDTRLATGLYDGTIGIWDVASGSLLKKLAGRIGDGPVILVAWSPYGTKLASGSKDGTVRVWDIASGTLLKTLRGHICSLKSLEWSSDETQLVSASDDYTTKIWDVARGSLLQTQTLFPGPIYLLGYPYPKDSSAKWSNNRTQFAYESGGKIVIILNFYLLNTTDIQNITLEQALLLKLLYAKKVALRYQLVREKRTNPAAELIDSIDLALLHDKLPVEEAQRILSTFSNEAQYRIIKQYNLIMQPNHRRRARPIQRCPIQ